MSTRSRAIDLLTVSVFVAVLSGCTSTPAPPVSNIQIASSSESFGEIRRAMRQVAPFFKPMGKLQPADWLVGHNEPGETFDEYLASSPTVPTTERQTIYVLPLGKFSLAQSKIIEIAAGYLEVF